MSLSLWKLSHSEIDELDVLFFAACAPKNSQDPRPAPHPVVGLQPLNHWKIFQAICELGLRVQGVRELESFEKHLTCSNFVFLMRNAAPVRNSEIIPSALCELRGVPYSGARPNMRALAEDKYMTKLVCQGIGIPVAPAKTIGRLADADTPPAFPGPYFVKPRFGVHSEGVEADSRAPDWPAARKWALHLLSQTGEGALVEAYIPGRELTVSVLGGAPSMVLGCCEAAPAPGGSGVMTNRAKNAVDAYPIVTVVPDDDPQARQAMEMTRRLVAELDPFDFLRVDFRFDERTGIPHLLEFNICCGISPHSPFTMSAAGRGITYSDLLNHIIAYSLHRQR